MKDITTHISEGIKVNSKTSKKKLNDEEIYRDKDIFIEVDEDEDHHLIRIFYKDKKCVKWWLDTDTIQTSFLPKDCDTINEYSKVFK